MSVNNFEAAQKVLHLNVSYPNFSAWEKVLDFEVDGVAVKAIAKHSWRCLTVLIVAPFEIVACTFEPPLVALGAAMLGRQATLKERGITDAEDCIAKAKDAYLNHLFYLSLKPKIDVAQADLSNKYAQRLRARLLFSDTAKARLMLENSQARQDFKVGLYDQKEYQSVVKELTKQATDAYISYATLKDKVDRGLEEIKSTMLSEALSGKT